MYTVARTLGTRYVTQRTVSDGDAVMFDIDDTLIHTDGTPIQDMIALIQTCRSLGYRIVIMTARPNVPENHTYTQMQLNEFGIPYTVVYFVPAEQKTAIKKQTGLRYILSVGDMNPDIGHSEKFIKLPNVSDPNVYSDIQ